MPIATYKRYQCPKCGYTKTVLQGDVLTSFPQCPKCKTMMVFKEEIPPNSAKGILTRWFGV